MTTIERNRLGRGAVAGSAAAFAIYFGIALLFFGKTGSWTRFVFGDGGDPRTFIWFLNWLPFAISHGLNPLLSKYVWFPTGANLTWDTSVPLAALLLSPVTLLGGAVLSFNLLSVMAPVLSAWTAFLLGHYSTRDWAAAVLGGYLFGFSSYEIGQLQGHLNLDLNFLVPIAILLCLRRFHGDITRTRFVAGLTIVCASEIGLSAEILATLSLFGATTWAIFFAFSTRQERSALKLLAIDVVFAGFATVVLAAPFLFFLAEGSNTLPPETVFISLVSTDMLNFLIPTLLTQFGGAAFFRLSNHFIGYCSEHGAYLGLPLILIMALYFRARIAAPYVKALLIALLMIVLCSLGPWLQIGGVKTDIELPWRYIAQLPLLASALPGRFTMYIALISALVAALWLALPGRRLWRFAFAFLACLLLIPNPQQYKWQHWPTQPFFTRQNVDRVLGRHRNVLVLPFGATGDSMAWQMDAGMQFTQSGGYTGGTPSSESISPAVNQFFTGKLRPGFAGDFTAYCIEHHVDDILVVPGTPAALKTAIAALGWSERLNYGVEIIKGPLVPTINITGDYWPSADSLNWMGKKVIVSTQKYSGTLSISGAWSPYLMQVTVAVTGKPQATRYTISPGKILKIHVAARSYLTVTSDQTFVPDSFNHEGDKRKLSVLISFVKDK